MPQGIGYGPRVFKSKGAARRTRKPLPSISRDPVAPGLAAGRGVRRRANPGTSLLSMR